MRMARPRVVIVGAGFAGLACARELTGAAVDVTVVDRNNFHTFFALLYQVATAELAPADVGFPVRGLFHRAPNVAVRKAAVTGVDWESRRVLVDVGEPLPFDHLVVAAGNTTCWFDVPGAAAHAFPLYEMSDAVRLRNHVLSAFEAADADPAGSPDGALTVVVVGGGPTGVEIAGAFVELFAGVLAKDFPAIDVRTARVVIVEARPEVLPPFSARARRHAEQELRARGVELRLGAAVASIDADGVVLASGERIASRTVVWCAGVEASPLAAALELPTGNAGRVVVGPDLRVEGRPGVIVAGDLAAIPAAGGGTLPQLATVATQSGKFAGREVLRAVRGEPPRPFRFVDKGAMATIGRSSGVADLPLGIHLTGFPGWVAWLVLHLWRILGARNKVAVMLSWSWNYVTWDRGSRLIVEPPGSHHP